MKNKYTEIINRAKKQNQINERIRKSYDYVRVIGVLSGLGFLEAPDVKPAATTKVDLEKAIELGLKIEPRILEVLPAAILSFPKSFLHIEKIPQGLNAVLIAIKKGEPGPSFANIDFSKFLEAARRPLRNKKRKSIDEKRISKTFRLSPKAIKELKLNAKSRNTTCTAYLESLIFSV